MRKRRPMPSFSSSFETPMSELNTTPLIDVMLVLLIMFIITIPLTTNKVPLDLPQGSPPVDLKPTVHRLQLDAAGRISLDGKGLTLGQLPASLAAIGAEPAAELHLQTDGETPYDRFDHVLAVVKQAGIVRMGMIGNERFAEAIR
jgi:biopolymer transport protein ExbD